MPKQTGITPDVLRLVDRLLAAGQTKAAVAAQLGLGEATVWRIQNRFGPYAEVAQRAYDEPALGPADPKTDTGLDPELEESQRRLRELLAGEQ
jgi:transposase